MRLCQAVRKAIGDGIGIIVDANHAYDAPRAIQLGRSIEHVHNANARVIDHYSPPQPQGRQRNRRRRRSASVGTGRRSSAESALGPLQMHQSAVLISDKNREGLTATP